jgi:hypothetical protein
LERKIERNAQLFMLHDLNQIFRSYIAETKIRRCYNEITEDEFKKFICPFNTSLGFDVATY